MTPYCKLSLEERCPSQLPDRASSLKPLINLRPCGPEILTISFHFRNGAEFQKEFSESALLLLSVRIFPTYYKWYHTIYGMPA
ncbi:MAG: hypothetical protein ACI9LX_003301 [Paraglaciecola sp.]|jgi:hypothetical protein